MTHCFLNATDRLAAELRHKKETKKKGPEPGAISTVNASVATLWHLTKGHSPNQPEKRRCGPAARRTMRRNGTRHFKLRATPHAAGGPQLRFSASIGESGSLIVFVGRVVASPPCLSPAPLPGARAGRSGLRAKGLWGVGVGRGLSVPSPFVQPARRAPWQGLRRLRRCLAVGVR